MCIFFSGSFQVYPPPHDSEQNFLVILEYSVFPYGQTVYVILGHVLIMILERVRDGE